MTIRITVDSGGNVIYDPQVKSKNKGKTTITWELKTSGYNFTDMRFLDPQPADGIFSNKVVKTNKITIDDDNPGGTVAVDYPYVITVVAQAATPGKQAGPGIKSVIGTSSPVIRNEPT